RHCPPCCPRRLRSPPPRGQGRPASILAVTCHLTRSSLNSPPIPLCDAKIPYSIGPAKRYKQAGKRAGMAARQAASGGSMKLAGKVAAITGAARGIGRACAERFLDDGVKVVMSDVDGEALAKTASELGRPDNLRAVACDVAKRADVDRIVATAAKEFGRLDIMVNNAGVARNQNLLEISEKDFDDVIAINLKGAFFGVQAAAKQMIA